MEGDGSLQSTTELDDADIQSLNSLSLSDIMATSREDADSAQVYESGIETNDFRSCTSKVNERTRLFPQLISDDRMSVTMKDCDYVDEGYRSRSIQERTSIQETEDNRLLSSTVSFDPLVVFEQDKDGDTDLHLAIIQMMVTFVGKFISSAPNSEWLNIVNLRLQTPLHLAAITNQADVVRRLVTSGAKVDLTDLHGNTPLHIACREGHVVVAQSLLKPVVYEECQMNRYEISYQRIPQDLQRKNYAGHTCLHLAAMSCHLKVMELLLSKGADVNIGDGTSGRTVLHLAAETGNRILLNFLLSKRRVNISCRTFGGLTPLALAAGRGFGDVVKVLLAHGADVTDIDGSDDDVIDDFYIDGQRLFTSNT